MKRRSSAIHNSQMRQRLATEAARIMAEDGVPDFATAKRKAAARLGMSDNRHLPTNREIEQAVFEYQRLFLADTHPERLREQREAAVAAMRLLEPFRPMLVGPVLTGTAAADAAVNLHLFSDPQEQVGIFLMEKQIPYELDERTLKVESGRSERFPLYRFVAGDIRLELTVFPTLGMRQAPLSPVDGRPMRRASIDRVRELLTEAAAARDYPL